MLTDILLLLNLMGIGWLIIAPGRYLLNTKRVADNIAAQLLKDYEGQLYTIGNLDGYVREQYMQLAAAWGLPGGAVDSVVSRVDRIIQESQATVPTPSVDPSFTFYE